MILLINIDILNTHIQKYISYQDLYNVYMSCNYYYNNKLKKNELEKIYYTPKTNEELKIAINEWYIEKIIKKNKKKIVPLWRWNTIYITNMEKLFEHKNYFNENINNWIVSNVKNMNYMFYKCNIFNKR